MRHVLVVGGTGILAPAVLALAERGDAVGVLARGRERLDAVVASARERGGRAHAIRADLEDPEGLGRALAGARAEHGPFDFALAYLPTAPDTAARALAAAVDGVVVHVLTTEWAAPGTRAADRAARAAPGGAGAKVVVLGWAGSGGTPRWHTSEEVSAAVLAGLEAPGETVVGRLRPWEDRPG